MAGPGICVLCLADLRCTQCSILLHLMDICFLTCICLWQISQMQTFLFRVVGPGLVSTSPAFVSNSASHPAGPHGRHGQKTVNRGRGGSTQFAQQLESAVTAPPLVGCVVWSLLTALSTASVWSTWSVAFLSCLTIIGSTVFRCLVFSVSFICLSGVALVVMG